MTTPEESAAYKAGYQKAIGLFQETAKGLLRQAEQLTIDEIRGYRPVTIDEAKKIAGRVLLKLADSMARDAPVWRDKEARDEHDP